MSVPSNRMRPEGTCASGGKSAIAASATVLLPEPDSPTTASVEPLRNLSDTEDSASTAPPGVR